MNDAIAILRRSVVTEKTGLSYRAINRLQTCRSRITYVDIRRDLVTPANAKKDKTMTQDNSDLMSRPEAAKYLGVKIATLEDWACRGRYGIPYTKIGRLAKYRKSDLDAFIESRTVNGASEEDAN